VTEVKSIMGWNNLLESMAQSVNEHLPLRSD